MDELEGSMMYAMRKCFSDARYKLKQPVDHASDGVSESTATKMSPARSGKVLTSRPYHSVADEDAAAADNNSSLQDTSGSDEIIIMDDDDEDDGGSDTSSRREAHESLEF